MVPKLIIFDCDGVLVDSEIIANRILSKLLREYNYNISATDLQQRFLGLSMSKIIEMVESEGITLPKDFQIVLRRLDKIAFKNELKPIPGISSALSSIKQTVYVASSGSIDKIKHSFFTTGLSQFFKKNIFSAEMVENPKPAPDVFLLAAQNMKMDPKECLVIEDSKVGILGALAAGMKVFGFYGGSHCHKDYQIYLKNAGAMNIFNKMEKLTEMISNNQ